MITFTSPLVYAENAKGQAIQSLGSTHTYFRRYLWLLCMDVLENDHIDAQEPKEPPKNIEPKPEFTKMPEKIEGKKGEFQIVINAKPDCTQEEWLALVRDSSHMLLDLCSSDADVMTIFKKNKVLFDTVKAKDPELSLIHI